MRRSRPTLARAVLGWAAAALVLASPVDERLAIGLLGFLVGDFDTCERALAPAATVGEVPSWVDAALGLVHCRDGMPALAYVHLSQAQRRFPSSPTLAFALQGRIAQQRSRNNCQRQPHYAELWPDQHCRQDCAENERGFDLVTALHL